MRTKGCWQPETQRKDQPLSCRCFTLAKGSDFQFQVLRMESKYISRVFMCARIHAYQSQQHSLGTGDFFSFEDRVSPNSLGWQASEPQESTGLCFPATAITDPHHHAWVFYFYLTRLLGLNPGPQSCEESTVLTKPSPLLQLSDVLTYHTCSNLTW